MSTPDAVTSSRQNYFNGIKTGTGLGLLAVALFHDQSPQSEAAHDQLSHPAPVIATTPAPSTSNQAIAPDATSCRITPRSSFTAVDSILAKSQATQPDAEVFDQTNYKAGVAKKLGLTVYNDGSLRRLYQEPRNNHTKKPNTDSFDYYFGVTAKYMAKLGVQLDTKPDPKTAMKSSHQPSRKQLHTFNTVGDVAMVLDTFYGMPKELVQQTHLTSIHFVAGTKNAAGYAITTGTERSIYLDVDDELSFDTAKHEFSHLLDAAECGSAVQAMNDQAFTQLNRVTDPYEKLHLNSYKTDYQKYIEQYRQTTNATGSLDPSTWCKLQSVIKRIGPQVQTISDYHPNVVEDKAETIKNVFKPYMYDALLDKRFPILHDKFRLSLARLYALQPAIASYYITVASHVSNRTVSDIPGC